MPLRLITTPLPEVAAESVGPRYPSLSATNDKAVKSTPLCEGFVLDAIDTIRRSGTSVRS